MFPKTLLEKNVQSKQSIATIHAATKKSVAATNTEETVHKKRISIKKLIFKHGFRELLFEIIILCIILCINMHIYIY